MLLGIALFQARFCWLYLLLEQEQLLEKEILLIKNDLEKKNTNKSFISAKN